MGKVLRPSRATEFFLGAQSIIALPLSIPLLLAQEGHQFDMNLDILVKQGVLCSQYLTLLDDFIFT